MLRERAAIDAELRALDAVGLIAAAVTTQTAADEHSAEPGEIIVTGTALSLTAEVTCQTVTTIGDRAFHHAATRVLTRPGHATTAEPRWVIASRSDR